MSLAPNTKRFCFPAIAFLIALIAASLSTSVSHAFDADLSDDPVYEAEFSLGLELDESHDLVVIRQDGDDLEIDVYMFDPLIFPGVPNVLDMDLIEDYASDHDDFEIDDFDELGGLFILCGDGNDIVRIDPDIELRFYIYGEAGDDDLSGGNKRDYLNGGPGSDRLFGMGGDDILAGFDSHTVATDGERDYLSGGQGHDEFCQWIYRVQKLAKWTPIPSSRMPSRNQTIQTPVFEKVETWMHEDTIMDFQSWDDTMRNMTSGPN